MRRVRVINATLILPDRKIAGGAIDVENGRIKALGPEHELGPWSGSTVDAAGYFVAPGFVDLHVHGGNNADFMDGTVEAFETAIRAHTHHGTTSLVPTSTVARHEQTNAFLQNTRSLQRRGAQPQLGLCRVLGAHLYGPYFNEEKVGCHPKDPVRPPNPAEYEEYLEFADVLLTATCAPELPGAAAFYRAAGSKGVRLNAGHSNATWTEMAAAYELGMRHVDHLYCAMSSVSSLRERCGTPMAGQYARVRPGDGRHDDGSHRGWTSPFARPAAVRRSRQGCRQDGASDRLQPRSGPAARHVHVRAAGWRRGVLQRRRRRPAS